MMKRFYLNKKWWIALVLPAVLLVLSFNQSTETPKTLDYKQNMLLCW